MLQNNKTKIVTFSDLYTWKEGHKLVLAIYEITKDFPSNEKFALVDQMCRAVVSITSNIAEGFSRQGIKEKIQFYHMSLGSITELQNQLLIAIGVGYLKESETKEIENQLILAHKLVNGLIKGVAKIHNT